MRLLLALVLLVACTASARPRRAKNEAGPLASGKRSTGPGQVTYLTADGVFVDRGLADGVKPGDTLQVVRGGKPLGPCTVTRASDHSAACTGQGFTVGDRIPIERAPAAAPVPLAAVPDGRALAARLAVIEGSPFSLVEFDSAAPVGGGDQSWLELTMSHTSSSNFSSADGPYQLQRIDAALRDKRLWRGLHASADVTVVNWSRRPAGFRSPLKGTPQLFVRQVELSWHDPDSIVVASVGRTWTRHTPGLSLLDGAQAGLRTRSGSFEGGAFGGLMPDALALGFSTAAWAAGAYAFARFSRGTGADAVWFQPEVRAGWVVRQGNPGRFEAAAALHGWVGRGFDVHVMAQAGFGAQTALDALRLDLGVRPIERLRLLAAARYRGSPIGEVLELGAASSAPRAVHADAQALLELSPAIVLAASGGFAMDLSTSLWSGRVGPELQLPRLFGRGGLAVGYTEELGWVRGRSAYLQASLVPHWRLRFIARAVWLNQGGEGLSPGLSGHELGGFVSAELRAASWLWFRVSGLARGRADGTGGAGTLNAALGVEL